MYIIDGIVSIKANEQHMSLLREIMALPATKVVEHPDIFVKHTDYQLKDFNYIIELKNNHDEIITYDVLNNGSFN